MMKLTNPALTDYCLAHLLRGVILRFIAHPEPHAKVDLARSPIPVAEADEQALISFKYVRTLFVLRILLVADERHVLSFGFCSNVFEHGTKIVADRHLVWFARMLYSLSLHPSLSISRRHTPQELTIACAAPLIADYELGRLYADMGQNMKAAVQFEMVLNGGKAMETNPKVKITLSLRVSPLCLLARREMEIDEPSFLLSFSFSLFSFSGRTWSCFDPMLRWSH